MRVFKYVNSKNKMVKNQNLHLNFQKRANLFLRHFFVSVVYQESAQSRLSQVAHSLYNKYRKEGIMEKRYSLELRLLHVKRPESELDDLVPAGHKSVEQTFDVVVVGVGKVWALKNARRLAKSAGELDALAR